MRGGVRTHKSEKVKKDKRAFYVPQNSWKEETQRGREVEICFVERLLVTHAHTHISQSDNQECIKENHEVLQLSLDLNYKPFSTIWKHED